MTASDGRLPTWIIIGTMKAATSSLHQYLGEHPQIATSTPKELDFFCGDKYERLGIDWYCQQFMNRPGAIAAGESSVNYTKFHEFPGVPARMHQHLPDVKLIYVLRDPIKRLESHWVHTVGSGRWRGDFESAVRDFDTSPMVQTSRYWTQLSKFLDYYDRSQIKVMSYDDLSKNPQRSVDDVLEFIGLERGFQHPLIGKKIHESSRKMRPNALGMLFWEDRVKRRRLRKLLPYVVCTPIKPPVWPAGLRERAIEYLRPEMEQIREFSGLEFPGWSV